MHTVLNIKCTDFSDSRFITKFTKNSTQLNKLHVECVLVLVLVYCVWAKLSYTAEYNVMVLVCR